MAPENNWLSFSLSPMEMLTSSNTSQPQQYFFNDNNFYQNVWSNGEKQSTMYTGDNTTGHVDVKDGGDSSSLFRGYMELSNINQPLAPKLEDFLGGDTTTTTTTVTPITATHFRYADVSPETQDSSTLTHMYEGGNSSVYFSDHQQDLNNNNNNAGTAGFPANSGSEVDDSGTHLADQFNGGSCIESGNELAFVQCPMNALSLGITTTAGNNGGGGGGGGDQKAIVAVASGGGQTSCKKVGSETFGQRTSIYRGVTRHRWTGRYEAHLWDNSCRREGQARKGRQVYLGGYDKEDKAARAYDLAALKYWGPTATTNFPVGSYAQELEDMKNATKQEFIASLRRKSSGFSRGASIYRGVTRHHQQGRWQARIGRVAGNKDLYLGTFATEEEAAEAYDIAAIKFRGMNAVTNFEMNRYDVEAISTSSLPVGGSAKRLKISSEADQKPLITNHQMPTQYNHNSNTGSNISFGTAQPVYALPYDPNSMSMYHHQSLFHHLQAGNGNAPETSVPLALPAPPAEFFIWPNQSY